MTLDPTPIPPEGDPLREDMERLAEIGERVVDGEPIESFGLTKWERVFVVGYVRSALGEGWDA